jgi:gluconolactonase
MRGIVGAALLLFAPATPQPVEVARTRTYTEGPVFDRHGNLFFTHNEGIKKLSSSGELIDWSADSAAGFNGHKILPDGAHLVCASKKSAVWKMDAAGRFLGVASDSCEGKPLRAPNDLTLDRNGGFYFTDPGGSREAPIGTVHYVDRSGTTTVSAGGLRVPNGLVLSADGKTLFVAETVPNRILRFPVVTPGKLGPVQVFATLPDRPGHDATPDGLALDMKGNLYVAHLGTGFVRVLDKKGRLTTSIPGGSYDVSNLVFGGPHRSWLYITGSVGHRSKTEGRVYRVELPGVRGLP